MQVISEKWSISAYRHTFLFRVQRFYFYNTVSDGASTYLLGVYKSFSSYHLVGLDRLIAS